MNPMTKFAFVFLLLAASGKIVAAEQNQPATAIFAGGCFWCVEADFDKVPGVLSTESGYTGGELRNPTYEQVSRGGTGHTESVRISYDPQKVSYEQLLQHFWRHIDPTVKDRQFCDVGSTGRRYSTWTMRRQGSRRQARPP